MVSICKTDAEGPLQDISLSRLVVIFRRGVENRIVFPSTASLRDINTNGQTSSVDLADNFEYYSQFSPRGVGV